jgi:hypothetical protein
MRRPHIYIAQPCLVAFMAFLSTWTATASHAHSCGPSQLVLQVGQVREWRIVADLTETVSSYVPIYIGDIFAADVAPAGSFSAHHGAFTITAVAPGTATLSVTWAYAPTEAAGICTVEIIVEPPEQGTGGNTGTDGNTTEGNTTEGSTTEENTTEAKPSEAEGTIPSGRLSTYQGDKNAIHPSTLRRLIDFYVPAEAKKLLVFAQCFGGDTACSPHLRDMPNTAIASATSSGQQAKYGGYHDDAARGLRPGGSRTAQDVHDAGTAGKYDFFLPDGSQPDEGDQRNWTERPITAGACPLGDFSLTHTSADGPVRSRHVVYYAGKPGNVREPVKDVNGVTVPNREAYLDVQQGQTPQERRERRREVGDFQDRDSIKDNFNRRFNTDVSTVGGPPDTADPSQGQDGWDFPGNLDGLEDAIQRAGAAIRNSENPDLEQFILFVSDHGEGELYSSRVQAEAPANTRSTVAPDFQPFAANDFTLDLMRQDPDNQPSFSVMLDFQAAPLGAERLPQGGFAPLFGPGDFGLEITPAGGESVILDVFEEQALDLDGDGLVGSGPEEGVELRFPVEEEAFIERLVGVPLSIALVNRSPVPLRVSRVGQRSGAIAPGITQDVVLTAVEETAGLLPTGYALAQNHPNPFNSSTTISFTLPQNQTAEIAVYSVTGQRIQTLQRGLLQAGTHQVQWDGRTQEGTVAASGVYFYELKAGGFRAVRRLALLK